jgi:phosphoribosylglycinamide formyltransferase-1
MTSGGADTLANAGSGALPPTGSGKRITVLISGRGSNLKALIEACAQGSVAGRVTAVISNRPAAPGLDFARAASITHTVLDHRDYPGREAFDQALAEAIDATAPDLVVLAGFMRILTDIFVRRFQGRMVNIHPSLLPAFRGLHTHERALAAGVSKHGASVHFVTPELDGGPVIMQASVPVYPEDDPNTLAAKVQRAEHRLYPAAVGLICSGTIEQRGDRVFFDGRPLARPLQLDDLPEAATRCAGPC